MPLERHPTQVFGSYLAHEWRGVEYLASSGQGYSCDASFNFSVSLTSALTSLNGEQVRSLHVDCIRCLVHGRRQGVLRGAWCPRSICNA